MTTTYRSDKCLRRSCNQRAMADYHLCEKHYKQHAELATYLEKFTNPDPLCPKCGRHRSFCKHSGFDAKEHVKELPVPR